MQPTGRVDFIDLKMAVRDMVDCCGSEDFDDDGGVLGVQQMWIGVVRFEGSTFGYSNPHVTCPDC